MSTNDEERTLQKLGKNPAGEDIFPEYSTLFGERNLFGDYKFTHLNPDKPEEYYVEESNPITGKYSTRKVSLHEIPGDPVPVKAITQSFEPGHTREFTQGSAAKTTMSHIHETGDANRLGEYTKDSVDQITGYKFTTDVGNIHTSRLTDINYTVGSSVPTSMDLSSGDKVYNHDGDIHQAFEGDHVTSVRGNDIRMIREGEHALHVQEGNYDVDIKGLARVFSEDEMLIESLTKITIKVGNSTIILTPDNIELDSPRIDLN